MNDPPKPYGEGRTRSNVSYADVERAAISILKSERRPTVETLREALGGGSPDTIAAALRRFWRDLGARIDGDPAALSRMPTDIAELADGIWQRALKLAGEAATHDDNAARQRLAQLQLETDLRQRSFELREQEIDTQARARERALADARDHLLLLSKALSREQATNQSHERRIADLEAQIAQYREHITGLIAAAIVANGPRRRAANREKITAASGRRRVPKRSARKGVTPTARKTASKPRSSRQSPQRRTRKTPRRRPR
jgi:hypothetical protein